MPGLRTIFCSIQAAAVTPVCVTSAGQEVSRLHFGKQVEPLNISPHTLDVDRLFLLTVTFCAFQIWQRRVFMVRCKRFPLCFVLLVPPFLRAEVSQRRFVLVAAVSRLVPPSPLTTSYTPNSRTTPNPGLLLPPTPTPPRHFAGPPNCVGGALVPSQPRFLRPTFHSRPVSRRTDLRECRQAAECAFPPRTRLRHRNPQRTLR